MTDSVISMNTDQQLMSFVELVHGVAGTRIGSEDGVLFFCFSEPLGAVIVSSRWVAGSVDVGMCNFSRRSVEGMGRHYWRLVGGP